MLKTTFFIILIFLFQLSAKLNVITEEYPPNNYTENGEIKGFCTETVVEILNRAKIDFSIKVKPWPRAYKEVLKNENTALYSMAHSPEREKLFELIGPIAETKIVIIGLKNKKFNFTDVSELDVYRTGVIKDDIGEQLLLKNGFSKRAFQYVAKPELNLQKIIKHRIDLIAYDEYSLRYLAKKENINFKRFKIVHVLKVGQGYIAFNKNFDKDKLKLIDAKLKEIKDDGTYDKILKRNGLK